MANNKELRDERGTYVWRTVGGRHIKIYTGQTLAQAMKESGKFKNSLRKIEDKYKEDRKSIVDERQTAFRNMRNAERQYGNLSDEYEKWYKEYNRKSDDLAKLDANKRLDDHAQIRRELNVELPNQDGLSIKQEQLDRLRKAGNDNELDWVKFSKEVAKNEDYLSLKEQYESEFKAREDKIKAMKPNDKNYDVEKNHLESQQRDLVAKINELDKKQGLGYSQSQNNLMEDFEYDLYKRAKENPESIDPMTENSTDWEALDKKYSNRYDRELLSRIGYKTKEEQDKILADREGRAISYEDYEKKMAEREKRLREKEQKEQLRNTEHKGYQKREEYKEQNAYNEYEKARQKYVDTEKEIKKYEKSGGEWWSDKAHKLDEKRIKLSKDKEQKMEEWEIYWEGNEYQNPKEYTGNISKLKAKHTKEGIANYKKEANDKIREIITGKSRADKGLEKYGLRVERDNSAQKEFGKRYFGKKVDIINDKTGKTIHSYYDNYWDKDNSIHAKYIGDTRGTQWHTIKNGRDNSDNKKNITNKFNYYDYLKKPINTAKNEGDTLGQKVAQYKQDKAYLKQNEYKIKEATKTAERYLKTKNELEDYKQRYKGTYEYLKNTTNMSGAEILEYLKKIKD